MKEKILTVLMIVCLFAFAAPPLYAEDQARYLCVADQVVGFVFDATTNAWRQGNFEKSKEEYIISKTGDSKSKWEVKGVGNDFDRVTSAYDFDENGYIEFNRGAGIFRFSRQTGRYLRAEAWGYVLGDEDKYTPYIEIGKCSPH